MLVNVRSGSETDVLGDKQQCPLYPSKRTWIDDVDKSAGLIGIGLALHLRSARKRDAERIKARLIERAKAEHAYRARVLAALERKPDHRHEET